MTDETRDLKADELDELAMYELDMTKLMDELDNITETTDKNAEE